MYSVVGVMLENVVPKTNIMHGEVGINQESAVYTTTDAS